jgi:hypothetical protein
MSRLPGGPVLFVSVVVAAIGAVRLLVQALAVRPGRASIPGQSCDGDGSAGNGSGAGRAEGDQPRVWTPDGRAGALDLVFVDGDGRYAIAIVEHDDGLLEVYDAADVELEPSS